MFYLWPENLPVLRLWQGVSTQWRHIDGHRCGLDYAGVRAAPAFLEIRGRRAREDAFAGVVCMEFAWLAERRRVLAQRNATAAT